MKFLLELWNRFSLKTPQFFQIIQAISVITALVAGLPALVAQFQTELNIILPVWIVAIANKTVAISAMVAWVIAKLPVSNTGNTTMAKQLPFTDKA